MNVLKKLKESWKGEDSNEEELSDYTYYSNWNEDRIKLLKELDKREGLDKKQKKELRELKEKVSEEKRKQKKISNLSPKEREKREIEEGIKKIKEEQTQEKEYEKNRKKEDEEHEKRVKENNIKFWEDIREVAREIAKEEIRKLKIPSRGIPNIDKLKSKLLIKQKGKCAICKQDLDEEFHIDHIFPYSKKFGYSNGFENINEKSNLQLLCKECNWNKGTK